MARSKEERHTKLRALPLVAAGVSGCVRFRRSRNASAVWRSIGQIAERWREKSLLGGCRPEEHRMTPSLLVHGSGTDCTSLQLLTAETWCGPCGGLRGLKTGRGVETDGSILSSAPLAASPLISTIRLTVQSVRLGLALRGSKVVGKVKLRLSPSVAVLPDDRLGCASARRLVAKLCLHIYCWEVPVEVAASIAHARAVIICIDRQLADMAGR